MRIIGGEWRGRRLEVPPDIRPMLDQERERLFGILGTRVEGAAVLDVFAGSGAISLEALSRGARLATLVENGRHVLPVLRRNLETLGAGAVYTIETGDVATLLRTHTEAFDVIWLDPPYASADGPNALDAAAGALAPGGVVVLERATRREPDVPASLARIRDVKSGDSTLTFFTRA